MIYKGKKRTLQSVYHRTNIWVKVEKNLSISSSASFPFSYLSLLQSCCNAGLLLSSSNLLISSSTLGLVLLRFNAYDSSTIGIPCMDVDRTCLQFKKTVVDPSDPICFSIDYRFTFCPHCRCTYYSHRCRSHPDQNRCFLLDRRLRKILHRHRFHRMSRTNPPHSVRALLQCDRTVGVKKKVSD